MESVFIKIKTVTPTTVDHSYDYEVGKVHRIIARDSRSKTAFYTSNCISHPDVIDYIKSKREDGRFRQFNLSLLITSDFMNAVKDDLPWKLSFPLNTKEAEADKIDLSSDQIVWRDWPIKDTYIVNENGQVACRVTNVLPARRLWNVIMTSTYDFAEPGFILIDKVNEMNNNWWCENIRATNPCITGDTKIAVAGRGPVKIRQLAKEGIDVPVHCQNIETDETLVKMGRNPRKTGKDHKVYKITLDDGSFFKANANHNMYLRDGSKVEVKDLEAGDSLIPFILKRSKKGKKAKSNAGKVSIAQRALKCGSMLLYLGYKISQNTWDNLRSELHEAGIKSTVSAAWIEDYWNSDWKQFKQECKDYNHKVVSVEYCGTEDVYNITVDDVHNYCIVTDSWEEKGKTYWSGIVSANCGEQPLPPYGSCLLGSINLTKFVENPFTPEAYFDFEKYKRVIRIFTRMLDNVVEINGLPLEQQRVEIVNKRRHGMGYLGLGSSIAMLCLKYGEQESLDFTENVTKLLAHEGWIASLELAKEKGPAPIMEQDFEVTLDMLHKRPEMKNDGCKVGDIVKGKVLHSKYSRYMQRLASIDRELVNELIEVGARFTHHTSIAPTGTISLSIGNNCCLSKGSIVNSDIGEISIEDVTLDRRVETYDIETDSFIFSEIEFAGLTRKQTEVLEIELDSGKKLRATFDHEFLVKVGDDLKYETLHSIIQNGYELYEVVVK